MKSSLRIAIMVRSYIPMPRPVDMIYAPIDLSIAIAKGLGARGHQVTLFAPLGTEVHGENVTVETLNMRSLVSGQDKFAHMLKQTDELMHDVPGLWDRYMSNAMFEQAADGKFDLLYFNHPEVALSTASNYLNIPVAYTLHDPVYSYYREVFEMFSSSNQHFISISNNQRRDAPDLPYAATVYNGTDVNLFEYSETCEDYLLFAGRITPEKGVKEAIQVARGSNHRLLIIGPVGDEQKGYFEQYIKPELDDKILYLGRVDQDRLPKYYQKAKAVLTPVQWEEPFGLTTIEAMACGTPVISLHRGAAPEIIEDGKTGFVVNSIADMIAAVDKVPDIKRVNCRRHVEEKFGIAQMVAAYEEVFQNLVSGRPQQETSEQQGISPITQKLKTRVKRLLGS